MAWKLFFSRVLGCRCFKFQTQSKTKSTIGHTAYPSNSVKCNWKSLNSITNRKRIIIIGRITLPKTQSFPPLVPHPLWILEAGSVKLQVFFLTDPWTMLRQWAARLAQLKDTSLLKNHPNWRNLQGVFDGQRASAIYEDGPYNCSILQISSSIYLIYQSISFLI